MKNKKALISIIAVAVVAVIGIALYFTVFQKGSMDREANARHIISLMTTYPDTRYFDPEAITYLGEGVVTTPEEKEKVKAASEKASQNWEEAVGSYFAPNCFPGLLTYGQAQRFLSDAYFMEQSLSLKEVTLSQEDPYFLDFTVTLLVNGEERQETIRFRNDENNLFTFVEIQP